MAADVFFCPVPDSEDPAIPRKLRALFEAVGAPALMAAQDLVALKTHFGEKGNTTHVGAARIRALVDLVKERDAQPYLTETSVLYKSRRMNAVSHILLAYEHGFTFEKVGAPILMADGLRGNLGREVPVGDGDDRTVSVAADALSPDAMLVVSHATGHIGAAFGAAIKNLGMGLAARKGKLVQHSVSKPYVEAKACTGCGTCLRWCPADAIGLEREKARIDPATCIGCGECITVCKFNAVAFRWDGASADLQRRMAEHACGLARAMAGRLVFFNFLMDMTRDCDCMGGSPKVMADIGILASTDPVAIDMATLDLTRARGGKDLAAATRPELDPMIQINHGAGLGMGTKEYVLKELLG